MELVLFYDESCEEAKEIAREVAKRVGISCREIDVSEEREKAEEYGVEEVPCFFLDKVRIGTKLSGNEVEKKIKSLKEGWIIDFNVLKEVIKRNRMCLCKLDTKCICEEFLREGKCECGLFKRLIS